MARFRVYVKPFDQNGEYLDDFIEVTRDVVSLKGVSQTLDSSEFDVGIFRNGGFGFILKNDEGKYSDVTNVRSIFRTKRADSIVRVTWDRNDFDLLCGFFNAGEEYLSEPVTIFEGLLSDVTASSTIARQEAEFRVLGYESLLDRALVPFTDIAAGDTFAEIIYSSLNQTSITNLLTVDIANIVPAVDLVTDTVEELENQTVKEMLEDVLLASNSVLYIRDGIIYVTARTPSASLDFQFYGQASDSGIENVIDIAKLRDGQNRTFNFWTWEDTTSFSKDETSLDTYGALKKEIKSTLILDASTTKIQQVLDGYRDEFSFPKMEMEIETPMTEESLALYLLDRVSLDYPNVFEPADNNVLPRYGQVVYGDAKYPFGQFSLRIPSSWRFKILSRKIDVTKQTVTFGIRRI